MCPGDVRDPVLKLAPSSTVLALLVRGDCLEYETYFNRSGTCPRLAGQPTAHPGYSDILRTSSAARLP
ncbi:hypothetical protein ARTHRO9AX_20343 [Arthrobacter sp. 9AX]|nr:hypothetical protein ARTHRO9AX_20343 [Arthrobacter sp. 9AX]